MYNIVDILKNCTGVNLRVVRNTSFRSGIQSGVILSYKYDFEVVLFITDAYM